MKTTLKNFIAVVLFVLAITTTLSASPLKLFTIDNLSSFSLGTVTIVNDDGDRTKVDVSGPGTFSGSIGGRIEKVVINHQSIHRGDQLVDITLESGFVVQVSVTGNQIVVTDQNIIYDETKKHKH